MKILCVWGLVLILIEGFIIECEGGNVIGNLKDPITGVCSNNPELPNILIAEILYRAGFETTKNAAKAKIRSREAIDRILEDHIIIIKSPQVKQHNEIIEFHQKDERCLEIHNYDKLMKLLHHLGEHVRRIRIHYYNMNDGRDINKNVIKKYAKQLTELAMFTQLLCHESYIEQIWQDISSENGENHFPELKKFEYHGRITKNPFDVNSIFPKLEIFKLVGEVDDINCLANVRHLKELSLNTESIGEDQLVNIIANNKQLTKLNIWNNNKITIRTVRTIANNLKDLKTFTIGDVATNFFVSTTNDVYNLTSVISFSVFSDRIENLYGNISFNMPNLENLKLLGWNFDHRITNFINRFHKLKAVFVDGLAEDSFTSCIEKLTHIKEFSTVFVKSQLSSLKVFFENFDASKSLNTLKLLNFDYSEYPFCAATMNEINIHLKESKKPTWQISYGYVDQPKEYKGYYLMFGRDP
ncbi:uncharacterized protein LOC116341639 [Contarinia nasturtii]|uniref:uncharacterized protein LOC116341639 n=1 Tax=Contarinia nasturtii TaxID=265458 RepID=UPI0012D390A4|nr:uncharacterized protein LOC116341639 [Contarinia nasturtii]